MPRPAITHCRGIYSVSRETRGRDALSHGGATRTELQWQPLEFQPDSCAEGRRGAVHQWVCVRGSPWNSGARANANPGPTQETRCFSRVAPVISGRVICTPSVVACKTVTVHAPSDTAAPPRRPKRKAEHLAGAWLELLRARIAAEGLRATARALDFYPDTLRRAALGGPMLRGTVRALRSALAAEHHLTPRRDLAA